MNLPIFLFGVRTHLKPQNASGIVHFARADRKIFRIEAFATERKAAGALRPERAILDNHIFHLCRFRRLPRIMHIWPLAAFCSHRIIGNIHIYAADSNALDTVKIYRIGILPTNSINDLGENAQVAKLDILATVEMRCPESRIFQCTMAVARHI